MRNRTHETTEEGDTPDVDERGIEGLSVVLLA